MLVFKDNEWKFEKKTQKWKWDQYFGKFGGLIKDGEAVVTYSTLAEHGLAKTQRIKILLRREATDHQTLKTLRAFFVQEVEAKIPNAELYQHWYLSTTKAIIKKNKIILPAYFMLHKLDEGSTQSLAYHDSIVKRIGEPKRISNEQAIDLLKLGEAGAILDEDIEGSFSRMGI